MDCQNRTIAARFCSTLALVLFAISRAMAAEPTQPASEATPSQSPAVVQTIDQPTTITRSFRNDATLHDITFINPTSGWAVGDRGVIWHTDDAGATWRQQSSPISSTLNAVFFVDAHRGWAAGGECRPYSNATRGAVLRTDDGGMTWKQIPQSVLPKLNGIRFFDRDHGIAFGQSAPYSPSGVYSTRDAGATWQPLPCDSAGSWLAGDFLAPDTGAVAGPAGRIATLVRRKVVESPLSASALRSFRAMRLVAPTGGWAVGDGGLLMTTADLGHSWQTPASSLPDSAADLFNFQAIAVAGSNVWIAGSPGTIIFHSPDDGKTWQPVATNQTAPIHSLYFVDAQNGWAAGGLGTILSTRDGGHTWQPQRAGATRAALLGIFASAADVPLELFAESGAADGYIAAIDIVANSTGADAESASAAAHRACESLLLAGAAVTDTSWRFPLPAADLALEPADLLAALNHENDGRAMQKIERHLVAEIRVWRPDVVVVPHGANASTNEPFAAILEPIIARAVTAAADPAQHTELVSEAGLAPWQVKKVFGLSPPGTNGDEALDTGRFSPWLGATLCDFTTPSRSILFNSHTLPPETLQLKTLLDGAAPTNTRGIFSGITLARGSEARRPQPELPAQDLDKLRRLATRRRMLEQLLERSQGNAAWGSQVNQMIDGLSDEDTGQLLVQLAEGYRRAGRLDLAADTYFMFARRTPDHPLVDPALRWLVQFYASSEISHRVSTRSAANRRVLAADAPSEGGVKQAAAALPINESSPPTNGLTRDERLRRAAQLGDYLKAARPALYADPTVRFAEITAQRQLGFANPAKRYYLTLRGLPETDPWRECAATEEWLDKPGETPPPKKLATCRVASAPPNLDGKLDDPIWERADRLLLSASDSPPRSGEGLGEGLSEVRITHDREFLYVAVHCLKSENVEYPSDNTPRQRDADLTQFDRVALKLDVDRDYSTAYELTVDSRGWTHDELNGNITWNPTWYVAAENDDSSWTAEAAISLAQLVDKPPAPRDVWAVAVRRTIPRTGYQTWSAPKTRGGSVPGDSPSQFGLLIFE
jgi:photosystem II stability/assembly factor-like uncharacterized protein